MNNAINKGKQFYSPQFSEVAVVTIRRLAWYLNLPMTETIDYVVKNLPFYTDTVQVCLSCKDKTRCKVCAFSSPLTEQEQSELLDVV